MLQHSSPAYLVGSGPGDNSSSAVPRVSRGSKAPAYFSHLTSLPQEEEAFTLQCGQFCTFTFAIWLSHPALEDLTQMVSAIRGLLLAEAAEGYTASEDRACVVSSACFFSQSHSPSSAFPLQSRTERWLCTTAVSSHRAASSLLSSLPGITIAVTPSTCFYARVNLGHNYYFLLCN